MPLTRPESPDRILSYIPFWRRGAMPKHCGFYKGRKYYRCWYSWKGEKGSIDHSLHGERLYVEEQCNEVLNEVKRQIERGEFDPGRWGKRSALTIDRAWETYQRLNPAGQERTSHRDRLFYLHIEPYFHKQAITDIRDIDIKEWLVKVKEKGFKPWTVRTIVNIFKAFLRFHHRSIPVMPEFPSIEIPIETIKNITSEEQDQVHEFISAHNLKVMKFWRITGCRASEACKLRHADIEEKGGVFTFCNTKQRANNPLPITPEITECFKPGKVRHMERVFCSVNGQPYSRQRLGHIWRLANRKAHIKYGTTIINPENGNRHSKACQLWDQVEHGKISRLLGHASVKTTEKYYGRYSTQALEDLLTVSPQSPHKLKTKPTRLSKSEG